MKAFLKGFGIGVGLGLLFAPSSGAETRNRVRARVAEWFDTFSKQTDNLKHASQRAKEAVSSASETVRRVASPVQRKREPATETAGDVINRMTRDELMAVNGIGPVLAERIISERPFTSRRELVDRGILPQGTFEELERELANRELRSA